MTTPTLNLNGTSGAQLREELEDAIRALDNAIEKCIIAGPNGRDYPASGAEIFRQAVKEFQVRLDTLRNIRGELMNTLGNVQDQIDERKKNRM